MNDRRILAYALKHQGDYRKIYHALKTDESYEEAAYHGSFITIQSPEYPEELLQLRYPPFILFYCGDIGLLEYPKIAIVGSRQPGSYGKQVTSVIAQRLSDRYAIVSGMAKGIDAVAHRNALNKGRTIGVLGCGINAVYPIENAALYETMRKTQLLVSEYPSSTRPYRHHFPFRNRLIAALSTSVIVTEAGLRSGTFLTVNEALELNRDVYVVPHPLAEKENGCNYLIRQGANILTHYGELKNL